MAEREQDFREEVYRICAHSGAVEKDAAINYFIDQGLHLGGAVREKARKCAVLVTTLKEFRVSEPVALTRENLDKPRRDALRRLTRERDQITRRLRKQLFQDENAPFPAAEGGVMAAAAWLDKQGAPRAKGTPLRFFRRVSASASGPGSEGSGWDTDTGFMRVPPRHALTQLAEETRSLGALFGVPQEDVVAHVLSGVDFPIKLFRVQQEDLAFGGRHRAVVSVLLHAYPDDASWRDARLEVRQHWRALVVEQGMPADELGPDPLDELIDTDLESKGMHPSHVRLARLRGFRHQADDARLESLVARVGGPPARGKMPFWDRIAVLWEEEGNEPVSADALRVRWGRLKRKAGLS